MKRIGLYIVTTSVLSKQEYLCIEMPLVFLIYVYAAHEADGEALFCALRVKYQALMSNAKPIAPQT